MPKDTNLKPALRPKQVTPQVCATCRTLSEFYDGWVECERPNGPRFDTGDMEYWMHTCERWEEA